MPKAEWGTKRVCPATGKRFYDLNRNPIVSPYTGEVVPLDTGKHSRMMVADKADKDSVADEEELIDDDDVVLDDEDESADMDLGDDVLEEEDDENVSLDDIADVTGDDED